MLDFGVRTYEFFGSPMEASDLVEARLYDSEEAVLQDALRHLLRARPEIRIQLAIHRYSQEDLSLARAASLAGVSWAQMKEIFLEKGIQPRLGPEDREAADVEVAVLREFISGAA